MKAKNILMSVLLAMGFIAAKAATGYPPELALVSQPVMVYNYNSITVYYDVQNIGDYTYRGDICIYLSPDNGYCYADKYIRVRPGRIKRVAVEIPIYRSNPSWTYTIMPYYELGDELYSFTTFEYFEPLSFYWDGPRSERWIVVNVPPRPRHYVRPGDYRYYYDGFRPPMPPYGYGLATLPPPMNPLHHTYAYHLHNGGYPATYNWNHDNPPASNNGGGNSSNSGGATVRPNENAGSMSHGNANPPSSSGSLSNGGNSRPNNNGSMSRPSRSGSSTGTAAGSSSSGRTGNSNVSRPSRSGSSTGTATGSSSSGRTGNSSVSRPSNSGSSTGTATGSSSSGRTGNGSVSRPSSKGSSSGTATGSSSNGRTGNSSVSHPSNSGSSTGSTTNRSSSGRSRTGA